jgi:hypothetical protein
MGLRRSKADCLLRKDVRISRAINSRSGLYTHDLECCSSVCFCFRSKNDELRVQHILPSAPTVNSMIGTVVGVFQSAEILLLSFHA